MARHNAAGPLREESVKDKLPFLCGLFYDAVGIQAVASNSRIITNNDWKVLVKEPVLV
jgi:hypothetical protein